MQVGLSPVLPSGVCRLLFWLRCVPLPLLTLWADFAAWVPTSEEELRNIEDGAPPAGGRRLHRNLGRARYGLDLSIRLKINHRILSTMRASPGSHNGVSR